MLIYDTWIDNVRARLVAAGIGGVSLTDHRETPTTDDALPAVDVFISHDDAPADARGRTGLPQFEHVTALCIEVRDVDNSGGAVRRKLHAAAQQILDTLLATWPQWLTDGEGLSGMRTAYDVPPDAGEVTGRVMIQIDCCLRTIWSVEPSAPLPALTTIATDTDIPAGATTIGATITVPQT